MIDDEAVPAHLRYAAATGVHYDRVPGGDGAADRIIYYMTRAKFQKGLQKATKMGAFFAKRAYQRTSGGEERKWIVDQVKPNFALSLEGAFQVVTIGGKVSLEMTFKR